MALLCIVSSLCLRAQDPPKPRRQFEVASVKPNQSGDRPAQVPVVFSPGGRLTAMNATLVDLLVQAYRTRRIQLQGGPDWIDRDRFDVIAKADAGEGEVHDEQRSAMLQVLLEDRFHLTYHHETKDMPAYVLLPGKQISGLEKPREGDKTGVQTVQRKLVFTNMSMGGMVNTLSNIVHVPVVDRSELAGRFNFTLDLTFYTQIADPNTPLSAEAIAEMVIAAVREQLGFKLEMQKAPLDIMVIDGAERPSEN
jgi:uncharacterized protein (TIGR03435 family)